MALHIKSTRQWSNSTLCDGVDALLAAAQEVEQEEEEVLRMIEDPWGNMFIIVYICRVVCFYKSGTK